MQFSRMRTQHVFSCDNVGTVSVVGNVLVNMPALHARSLWFDTGVGMGYALLVISNNRKSAHMGFSFDVN